MKYTYTLTATVEVEAPNAKAAKRSVQLRTSWLEGKHSMLMRNKSLEDAQLGEFIGFIVWLDFGKTRIERTKDQA